MLEGGRVVARVLVRLAQGEVQMHAIHLVDRGVIDARAHRREVGFGEAERLEVGEAPVRLAEGWIAGDGAAVGRDALVLPALGLQHVAVAEPDLGVRRVLLEELGVHPARALVLADAAQDHGREIAVGGIAWVRGEQALGLGEGARGVV